MNFIKNYSYYFFLDGTNTLLQDGAGNTNILIRSLQVIEVKLMIYNFTRQIILQIIFSHR